MNKSIKKNYIYNVSYQVLALIAPVLTVPHLSRVLKADGIGTASYIESIVSYFTLFATMGITTYGQREISYVQDSREKRSYVFWNTKVLSFFIAGISIIIYILFSLFQKNSLLYIILSLNIVSVFFDITWFFQGLEEFGKIVLRNALIKIVNIVYIFVMVRTKNDLVYYVFGVGFFSLLGNISLWGYLPRYIDKVPIGKLKPFKDFKIVVSLFIPTIAIQIYTVLDRTMIGIITQDSYENGYYEQALKISKILLTLVSSLTTVMIPRIGFHFERGEKKAVESLMYRGYRFAWFLGVPLCFGLLIVSSNFIPWFLGDGFEKTIYLLCILSFLILAIGINGITGIQYLIPTRRQSVFTLSVIFGAIINFILNLVLIQYFQSIGAAIASVIAETSIAVLQLYLVRKELSPLKIIKESFIYVIAGIVMTFFLWLESKYLSPSIIHTLMLVGSGAIIYFIMLFLMRDDFFINNVKWTLSKIIKEEKK